MQPDEEGPGVAGLAVSSMDGVGFESPKAMAWAAAFECGDAQALAATTFGAVNPEAHFAVGGPQRTGA